MTATKRAIRTLGQLIAAGGLTAFVAVLADGLTVTQAGIALAGWQVFVTFVQNFLEDHSVIPSVLKDEPTS